MKSYRTMCKKTWAVILAIACHLPATWATNANEIEIIPKPVHVEQTSGNFRLSPKSTIGYDAALQGQAEYLQQVLGQSTGWDLKLKKDARKATILLTLNPEKVDKPERKSNQFFPVKSVDFEKSTCVENSVETVDNSP